MKHIFFDLDGTLVESALGITKAVQRALAHFGIVEKNLENLEVFIGPPLFTQPLIFFTIIIIPLEFLNVNYMTG